MKKLFISISAAFVLLLSCIIPLTSSAACDWNHGWLQYQYPQSLTEGFDYFQCKIKQNNDTEGMRMSFSFPSSYLDRVQKDDSTIMIELNNWVYLNHTYVNEYNWEYSTEYQITKFYLDLTTGKVVLYNGSSLISLYWISDDYHVFDYDSNLDMRDPIEVEVFPDLGENYNYSTDFEGSSFEINQLQVDIKNNTGYVYEYAILIQPKDEPLNVGLPTNSDNNTFFWGSSKVTYALVKDEWIQRDAADAISAAFNALGYNPSVSDVSAPITINTPSAWHLVPPNDYKREWLYYDSMQLKKGVDYTLKVYVYNLTQNVPSSWSDQLVYPAFRDLELVYSKDFSVARDTKFDPEFYVDGYSFDNTSSLGSQFDKIKGIVDPEDNTVKILGEKNYNTSSNVRIGSNSSFNSLISNSSSFLSLCRSTLSYLPDWLSVLLFGGMLAFVIAAIWRKI